MVQEAEQEIQQMESRRLVEATHASKNIAVNVLKKMHSAHEMFQAYQLEKHRLLRTNYIEYSVAALLALALLFSAGAVARHSIRARKWGALAADDDEALLCER